MKRRYFIASILITFLRYNVNHPVFSCLEQQVLFFKHRKIEIWGYKPVDFKFRNFKKSFKISLMLT